MKVSTATFFASSLSGLVLLGCIVAMWNIRRNVQNIWDELEGEMGEFKVK